MGQCHAAGLGWTVREMLCANTAPSGTEEQMCASAGCIWTRSVTRDTGTVQNSSRKTRGDQ